MSKVLAEDRPRKSLSLYDLLERVDKDASYDSEEAVSSSQSSSSHLDASRSYHRTRGPIDKCSHTHKQKGKKEKKGDEKKTT